MGSVSSSQSISASSSDNARPRHSPEPVKHTPQPLTKPIPQTTSLSTSRHSRNPSVTVSRTKTSVKERRVWYQQLKRKTPTQKAKQSALVVRSLMTGSLTKAGPKATRAMTIDQLKSQLTQPKTANHIIAELRKLPVTGSGSSREAEYHLPAVGAAPIHAVCLEHADAKADELYFSRFVASMDYNMNLDIASALQIDSTLIDKFAVWLNEIRIVDLITTPDFGLGQPGDGPGILAGAVPTPETVIKGIEQITPQLMALGYAAGKAIAPDHKGIFPPTDRISVLTYWWGLEVLLPPPTLAYLSTAQSISGAVMNFLTALSLVVNGVREIMPLARYISQFVDFEFDQIRRQDNGKGVVCAATWVMPAALVPRPWDFPDPPTSSANPATVDGPGNVGSNIVNAAPKKRMISGDSL